METEQRHNNAPMRRRHIIVPLGMQQRVRGAVQTLTDTLLKGSPKILGGGGEDAGPESKGGGGSGGSFGPLSLVTKA